MNAKDIWGLLSDEAAMGEVKAHLDQFQEEVQAAIKKANRVAFAKAALTGLLAGMVRNHNERPWHPKEVAGMASELADAMVEEMEKRDGNA